MNRHTRTVVIKYNPARNETKLPTYLFCGFNRNVYRHMATRAVDEKFYFTIHLSVCEYIEFSGSNYTKIFPCATVVSFLLTNE